MINEKALQIVNELSLLQELYQDIYLNSDNAYDILEKYDGDNKYLIATNYLSMAHNSYLQAIIYISNNSMQRNDLEEFLSDFKKFKFEFDQVTVKKDKNTSWLFSTKNSLDEGYKYVMNYTKDVIQMQMEIK